MRGPVGLVAAPSEVGSLVTLVVPDEESELMVHVDERFLAPPYLKKGRLLVGIEGYGRFWLEVEDEPSGA